MVYTRVQSAYLLRYEVLPEKVPSGYIFGGLKWGQECSLLGLTLKIWRPRGRGYFVSLELWKIYLRTLIALMYLLVSNSDGYGACSPFLPTCVHVQFLSETDVVNKLYSKPCTVQ